MKKPCRDCDDKEQDLGGCRCQTYLLAGDADAADPVCPKSPHHEIVGAALENATNPDRQKQPLIFRNLKESRRLIDEAEASALSMRHSNGQIGRAALRQQAVVHPSP